MLFMQIKTGAFKQSETLVSIILEKITDIKQPQKKFIKHILILFMGMRGRYNFLNMARYGSYSEQSYRHQFSHSFDFISFNIELIKSKCSKHLIIAFDPSFIPKSGKDTEHLGYFWSGASGKALKGLELGGLAAVDIDNNTAMHLEAMQTPSSKELKVQGLTLVDFYSNSIIERAHLLTGLSPYLVVDGYFAKQTFVCTITKNTSLHIVSKLRSDANLMYLDNQVKSKTVGRPKQYDGKVDVASIDKRRIRFVGEDDNAKVWCGIVYSPSLKRNIKIAYVEYWKNKSYTGQYAILFSTDLELEGMLIYRYYKSRFQIEFLFRDAKQFTGLTECQARDEKKLSFHFNTSLTAVSLAKAVYYLPIEKSKRGAFSMASIKGFNANKIVVDRIFFNLDLDQTCRKLKEVYRKALFFGNLAA